MVTFDPIVLSLVVLSGVATFVIAVLHVLRQPTPVAYIVTGVLLGPFVLGIMQDLEMVQHLGELGLALLLFFVGMEMQLSHFFRSWRLVVFGPLLQVVFSVLAMLVVRMFTDWSVSQSVLTGFVLSLSSTAVLLKYLDGQGIAHSKMGREITGILVMQDILVIPMVLFIGWMGKHNADSTGWLYQTIGLAVLLSAVFLVPSGGKKILARIERMFPGDHELHIFLGLFVCFGFGLFSSALGLSSGLGAFVAGMLVSRMGGAEWAGKRLHSFHAFFLALFFVSVGMLIDVPYLLQHVGLVFGLTMLAFLGNTGINAILFRVFGESWKTALFGGAMLAQIGELAFLLVSAGLSEGMLAWEGYQLAVLVISLTLVLSPVWIESVRAVTRFAFRRKGAGSAS